MTYAKVKHISLPALLDVLVPGLLVAQMIGRLGCIVDGDAYGAATSLPWGFIYVNPNAMIPSQFAGIPTHPYSVYDMLWNGISLVLLLTLRKRIKRDGFLFLAYVALYSVGRFMLTFVRQENQWFWGLQEAQVIAVLTLAAAGSIYAFNLMRNARLQKSHPEFSD